MQALPRGKKQEIPRHQPGQINKSILHSFSNSNSSQVQHQRTHFCIRERRGGGRWKNGFPIFFIKIGITNNPDKGSTRRLQFQFQLQTQPSPSIQPPSQTQSTPEREQPDAHYSLPSNPEPSLTQEQLSIMSMMSINRTLHPRTWPSSSSTLSSSSFCRQT